MTAPTDRIRDPELRIQRFRPSMAHTAMQGFGAGMEADPFGEWVKLSDAEAQFDKLLVSRVREWTEITKGTYEEARDRAKGFETSARWAGHVEAFDLLLAYIDEEGKG